MFDSSQFLVAACSAMVDFICLNSESFLVAGVNFFSHIFSVSTWWNQDETEKPVLLDRMDKVVTEEDDRKMEEEKIRIALKQCGYPAWTVDKVQNDKVSKQTKSKPSVWNLMNADEGAYQLSHLNDQLINRTP